MDRSIDDDGILVAGRYPALIYVLVLNLTACHTDSATVDAADLDAPAADGMRLDADPSVPDALLADSGGHPDCEDANKEQICEDGVYPLCAAAMSWTTIDDCVDYEIIAADCGGDQQWNDLYRCVCNQCLDAADCATIMDDCYYDCWIANCSG